MGGEPVAVFYDEKYDFAGVCSRKVGGRTLTFKAGKGGAIQDAETGTAWDIKGVAAKGEHAGKSLEAVPHYSKLFWFSWALFKPGTRVFGAM